MTRCGRLHHHNTELVVAEDITEYSEGEGKATADSRQQFSPAAREAEPGCG